MKRTIQYLLTGGGVVLLSGFLVNAMSVKKEENNIFSQLTEDELAISTNKQKPKQPRTLFQLRKLIIKPISLMITEFPLSIYPKN